MEQLNLIATLLLCLLTFSTNAKFLSEELSSFKLESQDFSKIDLPKSFNKDVNGKKILITNFFIDKDWYELEIQSPMEEYIFTKTSKNLIGIITSTYGDQSTPYTGVITNVSKCDVSLRPNFVEKNSKGVHLFTAKTVVGRNRSFGVCSKEQVAFESCVTFLYFPKNKNFIKLKITTNDYVGRCSKLTDSFVGSFNER